MNQTKKLIIIGAGEFAEIAYEYFTHDSNYEVIAFCVERDFIRQSSLFDLPIISFETLATKYPPDDYELFVAITFTQLNRVRTRLYHTAKQLGYRFATYISSRAFVWRNVVIGENCFIFENNVLQYCVEIGNNVILWSGNHIGHRSIIHDNVFLSSHVVVSGYCEIAENCFLGVNSTLVDNIKIAKNNFIAAGALITQSTEPNKIYKGAPAKPATIDVFSHFNMVEAV